MGKFLCKIGFHKWRFAFVHHGEHYRYEQCARCGRSRSIGLNSK